MLGAAGAAGSLGTLFVRLTADSTGLVRGMNRAETSIKSSSAVILRTAGKLGLGVSAALGVIGAAGVREFGKFDKAMTESLAIMGDVPDATRRAMEDTARSIARDGIKSAEELARSYFFLASAGLNAEQSMGALGTVERFATAGAFDMAKATDLLTDAQSALGLTVEDVSQNMENMNRISDVLVKANTLANATVQQFSTSLTREAGAALKSFNIDVEEGVAVLAAFADQGVKGEVAGSGLSRILRLMTSAAVSNKQAMDELGIEVFDANGKIRNLADIVGNLEDALGDMTDAQRVAALESIGFSARVQGVILPLLGSSDAIREYEKQLRNAAGTTEEVAEKQLQSFFNQLTITWHRVQDILISIGEELVPVLRILNDELLAVTDSAGEMNKPFQSFIKGVGPAFIRIVGFISDVVFGWRLILKTGEMAFLGLAEIVAFAVSRMAGNVAAGFEGIVNSVIGGVNGIIRAVNFMLDKLPAFMLPDGIKKVQEIEWRLDLDTRTLDTTLEILRESRKEAQQELIAMAEAGRPSERLIAKYEEAVKDIEEQNEQLNDNIKKASEEVAQSVSSTFDSHVQEFRKLRAEQDKAVKDVFEQVGTPRDVFEVTNPRGEQINRLGQEIAATQQNLERLQELGELELQLTEEQQKRKEELIGGFNERLANLQRAQAMIILNTTSTMFEDMASMAEAFAGRQSGLFKAMFAASKAFAVAESIVKIQQGIANAAALPFPANLAAIASVVAATANIVSTIQSTRMELSGKRELGGPVQRGGIFEVGERGRELFVPGQDGQIVSNLDMKRPAGGVRVVINNFTDAQPEITERQEGDEKVVEVMIRRVKSEIGSEIRDGRGEVNRAMESSFNLRRGNR